MRRAFIVLLPILAALILLAGWMTWEAGSAPVERHLTVHEAQWPAGAPPVRLILLSDFHVSDPGDTPQRLAETVARVDALHPDAVLLAGDFLSNRTALVHSFAISAAVAPLGRLRARDGVFAVPGNHDYTRTGAITRLIAALEGESITVLRNQAVRVGPLAILGYDDPETNHQKTKVALAQWRRIGGIPVGLAHGPDILLSLHHDTEPTLLLVGHTHCGQVSPWPFGAIVTSTSVGRHYACGVVRGRGRTLVVTAGLGVSELPFRLNAPPDFWVIDIGR